MSEIIKMKAFILYVSLITTILV